MVLEQDVHAIVATDRRNRYRSVCVCVCVLGVGEKRKKESPSKSLGGVCRPHRMWLPSGLKYM